MKHKRSGAAAKGVKLPRRRAHANAYEELPANPTPEQLKDAAINVSLADLEDRVADVRDSWETDSLFEDALDDLSEQTESTASSTVASKCLPPRASPSHPLCCFISYAPVPLVLFAIRLPACYFSASNGSAANSTRLC